MSSNTAPAVFTTLRFVMVVILSIILLVVDVRFKLFTDFRYYFETALYPVLLFADAPYSVSQVVSSQFRTHAQLVEENERLSNENYLQRVDIMRLRTLEQENAAMRKLLNSPLHQDSRRMFAEVINVDSDPYLQRMVVNRGSSSGVYEGMPVITDEGLVGQVVSVSYASSRVLLFSDPSSSIPVLNTRNQVRATLLGTGMHDELVIENVQRSTDIKEGDLLVTSGLGGVYPEGYPVAIVSSVGFAQDMPFAEVKAKPLVNTEKIRYVLMFWYQSNSSEDQLQVQPKEQTDGKRILRQNEIRKLIESLTVDSRVQGEEPPASVRNTPASDNGTTTSTTNTITDSNTVNTNAVEGNAVNATGANQAPATNAQGNNNNNSNNNNAEAAEPDAEAEGTAEGAQNNAGTNENTTALLIINESDDVVWGLSSQGQGVVRHA